MHPQGVNSSTFTPPQLDGSLSFTQILDLQLMQSPNHTAYLYDDELAPGGIFRVSFAQYVQSVHRLCRLVVRDVVPCYPDQSSRDIVAIFASTDTISYCMLVSAIMRAGFTPFCISPQSAASGLASLLQQTGAVAVYVAGSNSAHKRVLAEAMDIYGKLLPVFQAPTFDELQSLLKHAGDEGSSLPPAPTAAMDSTAVILHTSGSTSASTKVVHIPHKTMLVSYGSAPWTGNEDRCGQVMSAHIISNFHGLGILMAVTPFTSGLTIAVLRPSTPLPPTHADALNAMIASQCDLVFSTPACIETWSESVEGLQAMQAVKSLCYAGGSMNKRVGDKLVANGIVLCSSYGATEVGVISPFFESHGQDWEYFTITPGIEVVRVYDTEAGHGLYTHTYIAGPTYMPCYTNTEIDGKAGVRLSDLLECHPSNPLLHRVYGRKDDQIMFSTAYNMNPVPIEAYINRNPIVDAAIVFGHSRTHPGVLIQVKPEHRAALAEHSARAQLLNAIWTSIDEINRTSPAHFEIHKNMVLLADPQKPFSLSGKLQPRRQIVYKDYMEEIAAAYD